MRLVADIGGTNARLALSEGGTVLPDTVQSYSNDNWASFYDMLTAYLSGASIKHVTDMAIAVAGPVQGDRAMLTNRNWTICADGLLNTTSSARAVILNDLTALGHAVPALVPQQLMQFHCGSDQKTAALQSLVVGVGTGFNVSPVIVANDGVQCLSVEAGHVSMPSNIATMLDEDGGLAPLFPTVEELFSGRGFTTFCRHVSGDGLLDGIKAISSYGNSDQKRVTDAVDRYAALLGHLLRELGLTYLPSAGIYLAGSVARAIMATAPSRCIETFVRPCDIRAGKTSNLFVIKDDSAALYGCAAVR